MDISNKPLDTITKADLLELVWNAAEYVRSMNYDEQGKWKPRR